jgi:hypothetical protein
MPERHPVGVDLESQPLVDGRVADDGGDVVEHRREVEVGVLQVHPTGLDLGQVEDVVHEQQQVPSGDLHLGQPFELGRRGIFLLQQEVESEDGVQRGANLVRHVGQEFALGGVRRLGGLLGPAQGCFRFLAVLDVGHEGDELGGRDAVAGVLVNGHLDRESAVVLGALLGLELEMPALPDFPCDLGEGLRGKVRVDVPHSPLQQFIDTVTQELGCETAGVNEAAGHKIGPGDADPDTVQCELSVHQLGIRRLQFTGALPHVLLQLAVELPERVLRRLERRHINSDSDQHGLRSVLSCQMALTRVRPRNWRTR